MRRTIWLALAASFLIPPSDAGAQGTARSLDVDPSIRAAGMGAASNAVFWGTPNSWANPALIAYQSGLRFEWNHTQLLPGLADDVEYDSKVLTAGAWGLAFLAAGEPLDALGGQRLDYGESERFDEQGNPIGTFSSFEEIDSWGFGVSAAEVMRALFRIAGSDPPSVTEWADVAFGMRTKQFVVQLAPADLGGVAGGTAHDLGLLVRLTPYGGIGPGAGAPFRLDLSSGWSDLSYDQPELVFINADRPTPVSRQRRIGGAVRFSSAVPAGIVAAFERRGVGWLVPGFSPFLSLGLAYDHARITPGPGYETDGFGIELAVANVLTLRRGWYEDREGEIDDTSWGFGIGLPLGNVAGVRVDYARFPNAEGSEIQDDRGYGVSSYLDLGVLWRMIQARREGSARTSAAETTGS